jgi:hypothetical protein
MYLAFSYNYASDLVFVRWLARELDRRGVATWHLDSFDSPQSAGASMKKTETLGTNGIGD